jgi:hypothetical protein
MGLESSTSEGLSSIPQNVAVTEQRRQDPSVSGPEEDVKRGGSLDSSRVVDAGEKPGEGAKEDPEADQANAIRNGSLDNARAD